MAKILFGVMGDAFGHVSRALAVVQGMPRHEFLFVGGGKVLDLKAKGYPVVEVPMTTTYYQRNRVDVRATITNALKVLAGWKRIVGQVMGILKEFNPDLVLTDYEFFSPLAAKRLGIPCISIDHQHFLTKCRYRTPQGQPLGRLMLMLPLRYMFSNAEHYLITSFFNLPLTNPDKSEIFPPILRREVKETDSKAGDHVLVYQTSPTFLRLLPVFEQLKNRCIVYGYGEQPHIQNVIFKGVSSRGFLADLASCRYAVTNGGHNVISEALFLGKPVFSFPIHLAYEQFFNAHMVKSLGFGDYSLSLKPDVKLFETFEKRLDSFRIRIAKEDFFGNNRLVTRLEEIIENQRT